MNQSTVTKYKTIVAKLKGFQEHKNKNYLVRDVNMAFHAEFLEYLKL